MSRPMTLLYAAATLSTATFCQGQVQEGAGHEYDGVSFGNEDKAKGRLAAKLSIDLSPNDRPFGPWLLGLNSDNYANDAERLCSVKPGEQRPSISPEWAEVSKGMRFPLTRLYMQDDDWLASLGPVSERTPFKKASWDKMPSTQICGPAEFIAALRQTDPKASFIIMPGATEKSADQIPQMFEFLTGDASTRLGAERIKAGAAEPIIPVAWELGNERDWSNGKLEPRQYTAIARKLIAAIRKVQPDAKIAACGATAPWHESQKGKWREWNTTVLNELGPEIQFITFHPYYHGYPVSFIERYMDEIDAQIAASPNPKVKIYVSEHGKWPGQRPGEPWSKTWHTTHALVGCLDVAEWMNRMFARKDVGLMSMHALTSGPWGVFYRDKASGKLYATALAELFKLYFKIPAGEVAKCQMTGIETNVNNGKMTLSACAIKAKGRLHLIVVNRNPSAQRSLSVAMSEGAWRIANGSLFSGPEMEAVDTPFAKPVGASPLRFEPGVFKGMEVPPRSILFLELERDVKQM